MYASGADTRRACELHTPKLCVANADANSHVESNTDCDSYGDIDSHGNCNRDVHANANRNANSYAHPGAAGYAYSKTSPDAEASPVALIGTVKAGTRENNSRVSPPAGSRLSPVGRAQLALSDSPNGCAPRGPYRLAGNCQLNHLHVDL